MKVYIDGSGALKDGQTGKIAIVVDYGDNRPKKKVIRDLGASRTNNECEYLALEEALKMAEVRDCSILTDSQLIQRQMKGEYKINYQHLQALKDRCEKLLHEKNCKLEWIPRQQNYAGFLFEGKHVP